MNQLNQGHANAGELLTSPTKRSGQTKSVAKERRKAQRAAWLSIVSWGTVIASIGGFFTLWHQIGSTTLGTTSSPSGSSAANGYISGSGSGSGGSSGNGYGSNSGYGGYSGSGGYGGYGSYGGGGYSSGYGGGSAGSAGISPGSGSNFQSGAS